MLLRPRGPSGVQTHVSEFTGYLDNNDIPVEIVTPFSAGGPIRNCVFAFRFLIRPWSTALGVLWHMHFHGVFLERALRRRLKQRGPAVVYCQCPVSAHAALRARHGATQRVVLVVHFCRSQADEWAWKNQIARDGLVFKRIRRLEQDALGKLDAIVFVSESAQHDLWAKLPVELPKATIPNFISLAPITPSVERSADFVTIGTLEPHKNHAFQLDVLAAAKKRGRIYTLDIIGIGPDKAALIQRAQSLGIAEQVRFLGYRPEPRALLPSYKAYLHSAKHEVLPMAIIEALAAGLPVIAAPVGGIRELFEASSEGLHWELDDADRAAELLIGLMDDEPSRSRMGSAARQRFLDHFDTTVCGSSLYVFLTRTLDIANTVVGDQCDSRAQAASCARQVHGAMLPGQTPPHPKDLSGSPYLP